MSADRQNKTASEDGVVLTPEEAKSRRARSIAIGITVTLLAILFYAVTLVRLGDVVANRQI